MKQTTIISLRWLRRISQAFFLCLFLWLMLRTCYSGRTLDLTASEVISTAPVNSFFTFDPLVTFGHLLSTHTLYQGFLFSVFTIVGTVLIGRFVCGWVCPFGTLHHLCGCLGQRRKGSRKSLLERGRYRQAQKLKYYILIFLLVAAAFSLLQMGIFDPLCLFSRSIILSVFPAAHFVIKGALTASMDSSIPVVSTISARAYDFLLARELLGPRVYYDWALLTGLILLALLIADLFYARFWCRFLCPLGALLGFLSRFTIMRMRKVDQRCTQCGKCTALCQAASSPEGGVKWRAPECHLCLNCQAVCPEEVMSFEYIGVRDSSECSPDLTRRGLVASIGAGLIALPLLRVSRGSVNRLRLLRPPGALTEKEFLSTCLRCGSCSRICPTNALHPCLTEAGIEGLWTPRIVPRIGYCAYSCTLCGQICPSHAIQRLTLEEKLGSDAHRAVKIGTAVVARDRCLVWAKGVQCGACQEVCPVSPKAIDFDEARGEGPAGKPIVLKRPVVDPLSCIGCGRCENVCPVEGTAAIQVYSTGQTRYTDSR